MLQNIASTQINFIQWIGMWAFLISYLGLIIFGIYALITNKVPRKLVIFSLVLTAIFISVYMYSRFNQPQYQIDPGTPILQ